MAKLHRDGLQYDGTLAGNAAARAAPRRRHLLIVNDSLPLLQGLVAKAHQSSPPQLWGCDVTFGAWGWKPEDGLPTPIVPLYTLDDIIEYAIGHGIEGVMTNLYETPDHGNDILLAHELDGQPLPDDEEDDFLPDADSLGGQEDFGYMLAWMLACQHIPVAIHTAPKDGDYFLIQENAKAREWGAIGVYAKKRDAADALKQAIDRYKQPGRDTDERSVA